MKNKPAAFYSPKLSIIALYHHDAKELNLLTFKKGAGARRQGVTTEAYMRYAAGRNDRRQRSRWHFFDLSAVPSYAKDQNIRSGLPGLGEVDSQIKKGSNR